MRSMKKNFAYQIFYRILTVVTPLITTPIITRALGADKLGIYSATHAFANYFMLVAMLGIEKYGQRTIAAAKTYDEKQDLFWEIFSVQFFSAGLAIASYYSCLVFYTGERISVMMIQGMWVISCLFNINWFFFGCEEFRITVTRNCILKLITVVCIVLFIRDKNDLPLYCVIMAGGSMLTELVLWVSIKRFIHFKRISIGHIRKHIRSIILLFVPVIALSIYHIMDKTMLDILSTETQSGYYYSVDKIIYIPLGLITAVGTVMLPRMSYLFNNETMNKVKGMLEKSVELAMFLTCAVGFGIASIAKEFIPLFFGQGYDPCVILMYVFVPVLLIKAFSDIVRNQFLIPAKMDREYIRAVFSGAITNVFFNALLIPNLGAMGAVIGTLAAEMVVLIVQMLGCKRQINFSLYFAKNSMYVASGIVMLGLVRFTASIIHAQQITKVFIMVMVGALVYIFGCILIWLNRKESIFHQYLKFIPGINRKLHK